MFVRVAEKREIPVGSLKSVEVSGRSVVVANVGGMFHAIDGVCPHAQGPLGKGELEEKTLTCPWHGWTFDVTSGVSVSDPPACVQSFKVRVEDDHVSVEIPD